MVNGNKLQPLNHQHLAIIMLEILDERYSDNVEERSLSAIQPLPTIQWLQQKSENKMGKISAST
jgi:hypothetical protein